MLTEQIHVGAPIHRGALSLFPLWTEHPETPADYLTGWQADDLGVLTIAEAPSATVPELLVTTTATQPVLLVEGETIAGGLQHRTVNVTVLVPAASQVPVPVACVEVGRWGRPETSHRAGRHTPLDLRQRKTASVNQARATSGLRHSDQGAVWAAVAAFESKIGSASPTSSYLDAAETSTIGIEELIAGLQPLPGQRGVIVGIAGEVRALELFDRAATFAAYHDQLVAGYAADALGMPATPTSAAAARRLVRQLADAKVERSAAVGLGRELSAEEEGYVLAGLELDGRPVHLAVFAA
jgi:hypothetical protein